MRETHTGIVFLVGDKAYKAKKPLTTDFLDFSTPERRERACEDEVALNRRLAPDSYLGVAHFSGLEDGPAEPVIVMRRYPDDTRLASLVKNNEPVHHHLCVIAETLWRASTKTQRGVVRSMPRAGPAPSRRGGSRICLNWSEIPAASSRVNRLERWHGWPPSSSRAAVRCSPNASLSGALSTVMPICSQTTFSACRMGRRCSTAWSSTIICAMSTASTMRPSSQWIWNSSVERTLATTSSMSTAGAPTTPHHSALQDFYIAYRAVVRAKVDCIRVAQGHRDAAADARRHIDIALDHLRAGTVRLILVGGGPGPARRRCLERWHKRLVHR